MLVRQLPGPHNTMGRIKFMFPNDAGVYLHDNPDRELFEQAARALQRGLRPARRRLAPEPLALRQGSHVERRGHRGEGAAGQARPGLLTYMTAVPDGRDVTFLDDVYGRDAARLAADAEA